RAGAATGPRARMDGRERFRIAAGGGDLLARAGAVPGAGRAAALPGTVRLAFVLFRPRRPAQSEAARRAASRCCATDRRPIAAPGGKSSPRYDAVQPGRFRIGAPAARPGDQDL